MNGVFKVVPERAELDTAQQSLFGQRDRAAGVRGGACCRIVAVQKCGRYDNRRAENEITIRIFKLS